jgi:16S rRNA processing protein RimM
MDYVRVGEIVKPHGIEGELVVDPRTDFPEERFRNGNQLMVLAETNSDDEIPTELTVSNVRWHQGRILLETREITDRNLAEELRDAWLGIPVEERVEEESGFYGNELIGLDVVTASGEPRGTITDVHYDETNPLATITLSEKRLVLPLSPGLVEEIDQDQNRIRINFPDGWKKLMVEQDES